MKQFLKYLLITLLCLKVPVASSSTEQATVDFVTSWGSLNTSLYNITGEFVGYVEANGTINFSDLKSFTATYTNDGAVYATISLAGLDQLGTYNTNTQSWFPNGLDWSWDNRHTAYLTWSNYSQSASTYNSAYVVSLHQSLTPVPEAAEWAMMLLGIPLLGWMIRRKQVVNPEVA